MKNLFFTVALISVSVVAIPLRAVDNIAIIFIVDQLSHTVLQKMKPYLSGGIKELLDKGIVYTNAHYPYARTSTGPGHATLNTGALPKEHGIIANYWYDVSGKKIPCDYDLASNAAILSPTGFYKKSRSAQHLMVDGISDQLMLHADANHDNASVSVSLKSRAAIFTAGRLGKPFFFDPKTGFFTSTRAYFEKVPDWVKQFNANQKLNTMHSIMWKSYHPLKSAAYSMVKDHYTSSRLPSLVNKEITYELLTQDPNKKHNYFNFIAYSPQSNKIVLDLAYTCLQHYMDEKPKKLLLWVSLSSLDKIGHVFGPDSLEYVDTLYHIDHYLKEFMATVKKLIPENKILYALTADHGSTSMVEIFQDKKFNLAQRILTPRLEKKMNKKIKRKYGVDCIVKEVDNPSVFLDNSKLIKLPPQQRKALLFDLKHYLKKQRGIKAVWTHEELEKAYALPDDFTMYYKNQLFPGRTGSLLYQTYPYAYVTSFKLGTGHVSCYDYTTHVPLIFYHPGKTTPQKIDKRISMTRVAPTLAKKLDIPNPSACVQNPLKY